MCLFLSFTLFYYFAEPVLVEQVALSAAETQDAIVESYLVDVPEDLSPVAVQTETLLLEFGTVSSTSEIQIDPSSLEIRAGSSLAIVPYTGRLIVFLSFLSIVLIC